jgi:hypothetical protein
MHVIIIELMLLLDLYLGEPQYYKVQGIARIIYIIIRKNRNPLVPQ